MIDTFRLIAAGLALSAVLVTPACMAAGPDTQGRTANPGDVQCSCRACDQQVCCQTPTGFAALDDKCKTLCATRHWVVADNGSCGAQPGCCPPK